VSGVRAYKYVKTGEIIYDRDIALGSGIGNLTMGASKTVPEIADSQLGKKLVDHAADYGLTKSKEGAVAYKQIVQNSLKNTTVVRTGTWKTLGECEFWISGNDVSIIKNGTWVSTFPLTKSGTVDYINSLPIVK
ncbi:Colicin D, partial [Anaerocolumna jejuensis DSM 15929]